MGEPHIFAYGLTVFIISIPFVGLLWLSAGWFGLTKARGLTIGLIVTGMIIILPWFVAHSLSFQWLLAVCFSVAGMVFCPRPFKPSGTVETNTNSGSTGTTRVPAEAETVINGKAEAEIAAAEEAQVEIAAAEEAQVEIAAAREAEAETAVEAADDRLPTVEELVEKGFQAKKLGQNSVAAGHFIEALRLNPPPDEAFYLMTDAYKLLLVDNPRNDVANCLAGFWHDYFEQFSPEFRYLFLNWLSEQDLDL